MNYELINSIACGLIALWATWCVLSGRVRDGILGDRHQRVRRDGPQPDSVLRADQCRVDAACVPGSGRRPPYLHGHLVAAREGLALSHIELRALHALRQGTWWY